jgi:hypothetical protein
MKEYKHLTLELYHYDTATDSKIEQTLNQWTKEGWQLKNIEYRNWTYVPSIATPVVSPTPVYQMNNPPVPSSYTVHILLERQAGLGLLQQDIESK